MLTRRFLLKMTGAGTAAAVTPVWAQSMPRIKWRLASSFPNSLDTIYGGAELIAKRVAAATDGNFQIRVFASGELVPGLQVLDAVQNGTVQCGHTASYYYVGKDPTFAFDTALPFGLNTRQQNAWMYQGGGLELLRELFARPKTVSSFLSFLFGRKKIDAACFTHHVECLSTATGDACQRILCDKNRNSRFIGQEAVQAFEQSTTAG
jgi:TRAP-type mannitol/chloroaromatic compound transport system substrate-binding protein